MRQKDFNAFERAKEHLKNLIRIPSPSGDENALSDYCLQTLSNTDFIAKKIDTGDGRYAVYAEMHGMREGKTLMFVGHTDTVSAVNGWETDPFEPVVRIVETESGAAEERIYGLGANDMKSGIALMLTIAEKLTGRAADISGIVSLAFVPDEEAYSVGVRALIRHGVRADFCIMTEPSHESVYVGAPGKMLFKARATGKAAHGARPQDGINAILEMGEFLATLKDVPIKDDAEMGKQHFVPFRIKGGPERYSLSVPYECDCVISKQLVPGEDAESVFRDLEKHCKSLKLQGRMSFTQEPPYYLPYRVDEKSPEFQLFENICLNWLGKIYPYEIGASVCDSNCLCAEAGIPVLSFGADGYGSHQKNEYMKTGSLKYAFDIYMDFIFAYLG